MNQAGALRPQRWVLLRGLGREAGHWGVFPDVLRQALGPGHHVVTPDLPGNGQRRAERSPATVRGMVTACRQWLREQGGDEPLRLVALSMGAMAALDWASAAPQDVAGCALINTSTADTRALWQRLRPATALPLAWSLRPGATTEQREAAVLRATSADAGRHTGVVSQWSAIARDRPVRIGNLVRQLTAAARYRLPAQIPPVPILVIHSAGDQLVAPACSRSIARRLRQPLLTHPWAGHDLPLDDPAWLAQALAEWARPAH